jgi:hypothetical protein
MRNLTMAAFFRCILCTVIAILLGLTGVRLVLAYAEEPINFIDPYTQEEAVGQEIDTIHFDLTYPLALAAGFNVTDSITLQLWDQLVDSERLGAAISYTNCSGSFYAFPEPASVCKPGDDTRKVLWPDWEKVGDQCITSRFGPYSPFFHFPRQNAHELGALHDWGWGYTQTLIGYEAYAWGGRTALTVSQADCTYTRTSVIQTTIQPGSLQAFATYLHSLGDSYSHLVCQQAIDSGQVKAPWGTHTGYIKLEPPYSDPCAYIPAAPNNYDAHGREYGNTWITDSNRTDTGVLAIYDELIQRSLHREGEWQPLELDSPLAGVEPATTLRQALYRFVHEWAYSPEDTGLPAGEYAHQRRTYAAQIAQAVQNLSRQPLRRLYLPYALR